MFKYEHVNLTQLGSLFGVSSHKAGEWLVQVGLRTDRKKPSRTAFEGKYVTTGPSRGEGTYAWVWHTEKTVKALEEAGHKRVNPPPLDLVVPPALNGPFTQRLTDSGMTEIVGGDGTVTTFVLGDENARTVCDLLNVAHRLGKIKTAPPAAPSA